MITCGGSFKHAFFVTPDGIRRGHGTYVESDEVIASVAGTIERVNKLVTVRAIRNRWVRAPSWSDTD